MFKCGLLATTAIVVVGSLSFLAAGPAAQAQSAPADRSRNSEFLCNYGYYAASSFISSYSGTVASHWEHVAMPIKGRGKTVSRIIVKESIGNPTSSSQFSAGIRENTPANVPGTLIAGGTGTASRKCATVSITIEPTLLKAGKTYWIEESVPAPPFKNFASSVVNQAYWGFDPKARRKAYVKHHAWYFDRLHSSVVPWTAQSHGVYVRVK
jgi:hypothetical protein